MRHQFLSHEKDKAEAKTLFYKRDVRVPYLRTSGNYLNVGGWLWNAEVGVKFRNNNCPNIHSPRRNKYEALFSPRPLNQPSFNYYHLIMTPERGISCWRGQMSHFWFVTNLGSNLNCTFADCASNPWCRTRCPTPCWRATCSMYLPTRECSAVLYTRYSSTGIKIHSHSKEDVISPCPERPKRLEGIVTTGCCPVSRWNR
jgi:hypothetical protein